MGEQRVYEVARELQLASRVILLCLQSLGVHLRSASSKMDPDLVQQVLATRIVDIKREARQQSQRNRRQPRRDVYWELEDDWSDQRVWVGPDPVTTAQAARAADVSPATIRKWVARGHLHPIAREGRSNVFPLGDVLQARDGAAAQPATRVSAHRRRPGLQISLAGQIQGSHKRELAGPRDSSGGRQERWRCRVHRALLGPSGTTRARWTQGSMPPLHPCGCHPLGST